MRFEEMLEDQATSEVLEHLCEFGYVDGPAIGIARQVMSEGTECLSSKQQYVYDKYIKPYLEVECTRCGSSLPTSEIIYALEVSGGLCTWCGRMKEKMEREDD